MRIHMMMDGIHTLGPGERFVVWVQGCRKHCPGCMSEGSRSFDGGYECSEDEIADKIIQSGRDGLTVSGGEPFLQAALLAQVIQKVRLVRDIGVIIYSGYTLKELQTANLPGTTDLLKQCDLLIDGEYVRELNDGRLGRGSSNQTAIAFTDRYRSYLNEFGIKKNSFQIVSGENGNVLIGIPSETMLTKLKEFLNHI